MTFENYKFRCSSLPKIMTRSRSKKDPLSQTAKSYLQELWIEEVYGRFKPDLTGAPTEKGTIVESDSLDLYQTVTGNTYFKNNKKLTNDFVTGTPDVIGKDRIIDVKSSWSIWTFARVDEKEARRNYFYQLLGYNWLSETTKSSLIYALVNTPEEIIENELYKLSFKLGDEGAEEQRNNYVFDDIPPGQRIKQYDFSITNEDINSVKEMIVLSRQYMDTLAL